MHAELVFVIVTTHDAAVYLHKGSISTQNVLIR